ncbi:response regulator transcription factor [bacterium SCSIO 12741]|nr:response regulator transcription factor [bacterium SCSIO 12741]
MGRVLIIEDDVELAHLVDIHLKDLQFESEIHHLGQEGMQRALIQHQNQEPFDLIILDLMLPDADGLDICRQLRMEKVETPVIMLTARSEEIDKVLGLEIGADDYIVKPFSIREFVARVKAVMRRSSLQGKSHEASTDAVIRIHDLVVDREKHRVKLREKELELTPKEFDLLVMLATNPGRSYSREQLLNLVWGYQFSGYEHTVNSHINRLRAKVEEDPSNPNYILTTWGIGYRFNDKLSEVS